MLVMTDEKPGGRRSEPAGEARKPKRELTVRVPYLTMDGPDGEALQSRQARAILRALQRLIDHPEGAQQGDGGD
ncbi:hypothetical protein GCM10010211_19590 [Streptomyces albospinus]|uniref:Uncharacterized protein n=1 Tax=Streptomyces albospinus TaxID=285515 RepID=A0ABQ2UW50_9ACTN|nr:hypothetical protein GCM10010211_19590 [Streptomyces albospinus]